MQMVGHNFADDRIKNDYYQTPSNAIESLIKYEKFKGKIWEPACGLGAISKPLIEVGYDVYSSDLIDRGYGEVKDFLKTDLVFDNIITNPPYSLANEFTLLGLNSVRYKLALLCKLSFLEGIKRSNNIFKQRKLKKVLVFSKRLSFEKNNTKGGLMAFAWFIYEMSYDGLPQINWI